MAGTASLFAAVLVAGLIHSWLGERRLIGPLLAPGARHGLLETSGFARATLRFAWHLTSIAWWGFAAVLLVAAQRPTDGRDISIVVAATFIVTGLVTLYGSRGRHFSWLFFLAIGALALAPLF
jgi:hypothetical protein